MNLIGVTPRLPTMPRQGQTTEREKMAQFTVRFGSYKLTEQEQEELHKALVHLRGYLKGRDENTETVSALISTMVNGAFQARK